MSGNGLGADAIRAFLSQVLPWPNGAGGFVQLHWCWKVEGKLRWSGRAVRDVNEMEQYALWAASAGRDVYFCTSLQKEGRETFPHGPPLRSKANALALKAVYADLDVKDGGYASLDDAIWAVNNFRTKVGVPLPDALVKSGSGLHVYWVTEIMPVEEWSQYADGLKACLQEYGVKADYGCTGNAAQLLRVPGTLNCKTDPPKPVELIVYNS